ncbi:hypothetical protein PLICRDRAFT_97603 [Plicaturopsis crispa FD-325 SS-3]|nr:hypothetical protein PLICRDRAFT_97603 [Plicaturopsis crispa FD-325 SS-3]
MVVPLGSPQPVFDLPALDKISDGPDDAPEPGELIVSSPPHPPCVHAEPFCCQKPIGPLNIPALVFGAACFSGFYNNDDYLSSATPVQITRLALRYGIRAFDTSPYYGPSEIVLGTVLKILAPEFPRSSYQLMTKCGRYGPSSASFDYSPATIRASVQRSLARLHTHYLDTVYLHDTEFVCARVTPRNSGHHGAALDGEAEAYGVKEGGESEVYGEGDRKILAAFGELRKLQEEGVVKNIGITGYPLPVLLRLALLILHHPPYKPVDVILSYSHLTLQNTTLKLYAPHFTERAQVKQLLTASPLSMGLLTPSIPAWHPAPPELRTALGKVVEETRAWEGGIANVALGYSYRESGELGMPLAVGFSSTGEVHESARVWREAQGGADDAKRRAEEAKVLEVMSQSGFLDWSWASP